jgi:hypothetical protein
MNKSSQAVKSAIWEKLRRLPASKQEEVLDFVTSLGSSRSKKRSGPTIYDHSATVIKRRRLKKLSLAKIAAIVHEVRNGHDSARSL